MSNNKTCPECGEEFEVILEGAEYCSYECEIDANSTYVEMKFTTAADMLAEELDKIKNT